MASSSAGYTAKEQSVSPPFNTSAALPAKKSPWTREWSPDAGAPLGHPAVLTTGHRRPPDLRRGRGQPVLSATLVEDAAAA